MISPPAYRGTPTQICGITFNEKATKRRGYFCKPGTLKIPKARAPGIEPKLCLTTPLPLLPRLGRGWAGGDPHFGPASNRCRRPPFRACRKGIVQTFGGEHAHNS